MGYKEVYLAGTDSKRDWIEVGVVTLVTVVTFN